MNNTFVMYLANIFQDSRNTHFNHLVDIGGRIYYSRNSRTFKMNQRKERRISKKRRR